MAETGTRQKEDWLRLLRAFTIHYTERRPVTLPLTDLQAVLLMLILEAQQQGYQFNQKDFALLLNSKKKSESTVSGVINHLVKRRLCRTEKHPSKRGKFPIITKQGEKVLLQYAYLKFINAGIIFDIIAGRPDYQSLMGDVDPLIAMRLDDKFLEVKDNDDSALTLQCQNT